MSATDEAVRQVRVGLLFETAEHKERVLATVIERLSGLDLPPLIGMDVHAFDLTEERDLAVQLVINGDGYLVSAYIDNMPGACAVARESGGVVAELLVEADYRRPDGQAPDER